MFCILFSVQSLDEHRSFLSTSGTLRSACSAVSVCRTRTASATVRNSRLPTADCGNRGTGYYTIPQMSALSILPPELPKVSQFLQSVHSPVRKIYLYNGGLEVARPIHTCLFDPGECRGLVTQILEVPFSALSKPIFASKYSLESS